MFVHFNTCVMQDVISLSYIQTHIGHGVLTCK